LKTADPIRRSVAEVVDDPRTRADLFNAFPVPVWLADAHGAWSFVNQAWEDYTGRQVEQELGDRWLESVHPEDRVTLRQAWNEAFGLRRPFMVEYRLRRADGSYGWIHTDGVPVDDEHGRLAGYLGTCHDITEQRSAELDAREKEGRVRMMADNVPALIAYFDARDLTCLFANKAYAHMWGWDERSIVGRPVREVIGDAGFAEISPHIERARRGESVLYERSLKTPDGLTRTLEVHLLPQKEPSGEVRAAFVCISDISRHRQAEQAARESELRLRKFADAAHAGIVFHEDGVITDVNDAVLRLGGYRAEDLVGSHIIQYVAPEFRAEAIENVKAGNERPYESEILHKDGTRIPVEFEGRLMPFQGKMLRLSVVRDIRRRKASQARIDYLAHHDLLTGLPNRALLLDRLQYVLAAARRREQQVALLFIDLDNFKTVNDSLGHMAGDELLKIIARRIQAALRSGDVVSRHGGDEFLVVLPDIENDHGPIPVAEKLLDAIGEPVELEGQSISVSPSIGISLFPRDGDNADVLIRNADAAMYLAKARGRNNFQFFNESLSEAAYRALTLETRMREAIRDQSFRLHYQPQMRVDTGALTGVEALIRWPQKEGPWIEPNEFIPVAEQRGLIRPIGSWVLREACEQNRQWQRAGLPHVPVAVNLSAVQFRQRNLLQEVEKVLGETGLAPQFLTFELTESMLMEDTAEMSRTLEGFKAMGVRLAIDDFGTGHSSLVNLKRFPIDKLKIDRTFVRDTPGDPDDCAIIAAIIDLARNMDITSIAEGVDRLEQLDFLRSRGCEEVQGFLFAKAMPPDEMARYMARPRTGTITTITSVQSV
jgi:diguanylate cyclase (GGDEF)-like protein/PAS domain S-box-containing protein